MTYISSDGYLDGGEPYTDEELKIINQESIKDKITDVIGAFIEKLGEKSKEGAKT